MAALPAGLAKGSAESGIDGSRSPAERIQLSSSRKSLTSSCCLNFFLSEPGKS